jgi:lipopolysaccharide export system permease protein
MFILLMQFVWKYVDDMVGKGLDITVILELLFFVSATLVPMAIPLTILLSSIMTFGGLAEYYEITALKAAGISLQRIFRPLTFFTLLLSVAAFFFANYVLPVANLRMGVLLYDVTHKKPALEIREGIFYNGIENYTIRVAKKGKDGKTLSKIMIYDHSEHVGNTKVTVAESGTMEISPDKRFLVITLNNGNNYEEGSQEPGSGKYKPFVRVAFTKQVVRLDLSDFKMMRSDASLFKGHYSILRAKELLAACDSEDVYVLRRNKLNYSQLTTMLLSRDLKRQSRSIAIQESKMQGYRYYLSKLEPTDRMQVFDAATNFARNNASFVESSKFEQDIREGNKRRYMIEFHKKFTLSVACLVLFFIGAPLGAIIRKGGLGMPALFAVGFFLLFYVVSIIGEKSAKEGAMTELTGSWLAIAVLMPMGVFLTYKATRDSVLFDAEFYKSLFTFRKNKRFGKAHSSNL